MYLMWDFILSPLIWCTISLVGCTSGMDWSPIPLYRLSSWIASFLRRGSVVQTLKMMIQPKMSKSKKCKKFSLISVWTHTPQTDNLVCTLVCEPWFLFVHTHHRQTIWCVHWYVNLSISQKSLKICVGSNSKKKVSLFSFPNNLIASV